MSGVLPLRTIERARAALARGEVVLYPTDTLLGLAVRAGNAKALSRLFDLKRRPEGAPVSLAFSSYEEIEPYVELTAAGRRHVRALLPGPFTLLLRPSGKARRRLSRSMFGPTGALAVRIPDHPVARALAKGAGPITSTSANLHGLPPCRTVGQARRTFGRGVAVYLPAVPRPSGRPSELIDLTGPRPRRLLRR